MQRAKVYLVGGGPGDPDLLTRKALNVLASADCVIHDRLISDEVLALANPRAAFFNAGKQLGQQDEVQAEIYQWILQTAPHVDSIVRLKCGDPMVFGRGGEEIEFLAQHHFDYEVVPGISSAIAAPGLTGIPLTYRGIASSFAVIAGHRQSLTTIDWSAYSRIETLVVLMGVEFRDMIAAGLIEAGRPKDQPVAFVENSSTPCERVVETTLAAVATGRVDVAAPAVMVIGEVVRCRLRRMAWQYAAVMA